ncbi:hypothetical protein A0O30_23740 [Pseudomonas sp. LLC-1]|uniref:hypothetical protein n=1 Tax=Pseudomonas sp. LLC-1 TaxID=1812180 RepID=UPI000D020474|nr:hypothetical protein [Pseudomonas sp. LLC-1]PRN02219.1 hypothetical protein A0O30_23740 [Pseudomonas sp. LLC-1]
MNNTLHGTVTVKLGDEEFTLTPTLKAVRAIESRFGGLRGASQAITALSVEGCAIILVAGAGLDEKAAKAVPELIWMHGVLDASTQLNAYLVALYNPRGKEPGNDQAGTA